MLEPVPSHGVRHLEALDAIAPFASKDQSLSGRRDMPEEGHNATRNTPQHKATGEQRERVAITTTQNSRTPQRNATTPQNDTEHNAATGATGRTLRFHSDRCTSEEGSPSDKSRICKYVRVYETTGDHRKQGLVIYQTCKHLSTGCRKRNI